MQISSDKGNTFQLVLATGAFAVCFAVFGSVSALMPELRKPENLNLTPLQVSIALSVPVLLGSLGRIPLGILADKFGGRKVFNAVMLSAVIAAIAIGFVASYTLLLVCGLFVGIGLASFSVGVVFVSRWFPPDRQGFALGIYGAGCVGQSIAAICAPLMVIAFGSTAWAFWFFAGLTGIWLLFFALRAEDRIVEFPAKTLSDYLAPLKERGSWVLSLYYFLTFGGFVAMAIYLPIFLTEEPYRLQPADAGFRTAGFVILATVMRPLGGVLADKFGGQRVLSFVFPITALMAVFMACPMMITFTVGALGMAAAIGLGNGAVFKLVPEYFPNSVGSVTGLVGAAGGLGGFFPPLVLGVIRQATETYTSGFVLLAVFALICLMVCRFTRQSAVREPLGCESI